MKCQGVQCDQMVIHRYNFHDFILLYIYLIQFTVCLLCVRYSLLVQKTLASAKVDTLNWQRSVSQCDRNDQEV